MAYRMRIRRRASTRRSGLARRYFKKRNFTQLRRMARAGKQACWNQFDDVLDGAAGTVKSAGIYLALCNLTSSGVNPSGVTLLKYRADIQVTAYLQSGQSAAGDRRVAVGIWKYRLGRSSTQESESIANFQKGIRETIYFPGRYMIGKSRLNFGFQWLRRRELSWPTVPKVLSDSRPDPIANVTWGLYGVRLKPYESIGLAAWVLDDHGNSNMRYSVSGAVRILAQSDAGLDTNTEPGDLLRFATDTVGVTYDQSRKGTFYDVGVDTGAG